ncbi:hypothetical protein F0L68_33820 [Solihabitans fulvus]|uniref:Uncharacterized protein n=1 Tax=Solihabitans fulvus TaxID=1892852 RepID=A0A5B2WPV8_9PSEU|nr:hypothetical protein [Solihabitans fulvus]KAA2252978.1 hypothetical protein F0L68_33820 [Solihabitans fulvus]
MRDPKSYDALSSFVGIVGLYEGLIPFPAKIFGWHPLLALPVRLASPAWWIVSGAVLVAAFAALVVIDNAKKRHAGGG